MKMKVIEQEAFDKLVCVADFEKAALAQLGPETGEYYRGGADDEVTVKENSSAYQRLKILPRYLVDVSTICVKTNVLGKPVSVPVGIAPTAFQRVAHPKGELATAKAADRLGTIYVQSLLSTSSYEEVNAVAPNCRRWAQIYILHSRSHTESIIRQAEKAKVEAFVITIDGPYYGKRRACLRNPFNFPSHLSLPNVDPESSDLTYAKMVAFSEGVKSSATWEDIKWFKSMTSLPVVLKGVMTPEDAELAVEARVDAVWISNHGGRQLDTVLPTIDVLSSVVNAVARRCEVYIDGGVNRGTDIMKALALGANMVFIGRAPIWGLTVSGEEGVVKILEILKNELELCMGLSGKPSIALLNKSMLRRQELLQ